MTDAEAQARLRTLIRDRLGAIMHNPLHIPGVTCTVCHAPQGRPGFKTCWQCHQHERLAAAAGEGGWVLADRVVALTYAVDGEQSNLDLHRYKARMSEEQRFSSDAWQRLSLLVVAFSLWHARCLDAVARLPVSALATVPSLRGRAGAHPLSGLTAYLPQAWRRVALDAAAGLPAAERRLLDLGHFRVPDPAAVAGRHVVLLEDTWVQGGHAQSAAAALRQAGAAEVTVLALARRLASSFAPNRAFIDEKLHRRDFDAALCPLSAGSCPP